MLTFIDHLSLLGTSPILKMVISPPTALLLALALVLVLAQPALSSPSATGRATWLWDAAILQDSAQAADFLAFAASKGVTRVYAGVDADVPNEAFGRFIEGCSARGITVGALIGNPQWILDRGTPSLGDNLDWIRQYQDGVSADSARFGEVHVDIEVSLSYLYIYLSIRRTVCLAVAVAGR